MKIENIFDVQINENKVLIVENKKEKNDLNEQKKIENNIENNDENNIDSENDNIKGNKKNEITELNDETKKKIIDIIKDNKTIYEKILLFKEISIKEIKTLLNSNGIIVPNHLLSQLLLDSGAVLPGGWNNKK